MDNLDGANLPPACAHRLRKEDELKALQRDPYVLAYRYKEYMEQHPTRHQLEGRQFVNRYYENLLANQPEPDLEATDDRSRAIRYAKSTSSATTRLETSRASFDGWMKMKTGRLLLI